MKWVRRQIDQYPRNRYLLTSRPFGFIDPPLISATVVQVRQFTDVQVESFVRSWYKTVEQRSANRDDIGVQIRAEEGAEKLLGRLYSSPALLALATNPLLLTMIASVHKYRAVLPGSRAELYREICQVFLGKRQEAKELSSDLSIDQKTIVLRHLAFAMMERRIRDISVDEACELIAPVLEKVSYGNEASAFLIEIEQSTGLLTERDTGIYSFAHLTFQEYLAALHIAEVKPIDFLLANLRDSWWREVILLRVANADATSIVDAVLLADPPTVEMLSLAAECVDQAREVSSATRRKLSDMISWGAWKEDPIRRRLVARVLLGRKLQHVARSSQGVFICVEPVLNAEYKCFLADLDPETEAFYPAIGAVGLDIDTLPVVGIGPQAATRFIEWAQSLGVDLQLPSSSQLIVSDVHRVTNRLLPGFWSHAANSREGNSLTLSALMPLPFVMPDFESMIRAQLVTDMRILSRAFAPGKRDALAISSANSVIDVDKYQAMLAAFFPKRTSLEELKPSEYRRDTRQAAAGLTDHLLAMMERDASILDSFDDPTADPVSTVDRSILPRLTSSIIQCLAAGRQWGVAHLRSFDECYEVGSGLMDSVFLDEMDIQASGTTMEARVIRAYIRMVCLSIATGGKPAGYRLRFLANRDRRVGATSETWRRQGGRKYSWAETSAET
jgi:hypothetical protein